MTEEINVKDRDIVCPGDVLARGMGYVPGNGTYRVNDEVRSQLLGLARVDGKVIKITPLRGRYMPKVRDRVVAKVTNVLMSGWRVDINSPYDAVLSVKEASSDFIPRGASLTQYFETGEYIFTQVTNVTSQKLVDVTMKGPGLRKLQGGQIINVNAQKVPRIIGKDGSMVSLLKQHTGCFIYVGQNGRVWLSGEPDKERLAIKAIRYIEENAHKQGVTEQVQALLEKSQ